MSGGSADSLHILIVDDSPTASLFLQHKLMTLLQGEAPAVVHAVADGEKALEAIRKNPVDVVLLDAVLPGMDGYQVCRQIKQHRAGTRVAMLTALAGEQDERKGFEYGCDHYIRKPASDDILLQILRIARRVRNLGTA